MRAKTQHLFCPVAMACEMLEPRWTMLILFEMWSGSTRFNDIHKGMPAMSPSLLSKRLKDMETKGLVQRVSNPNTKKFLYFTTELSDKLRPLIYQLGEWAYQNVQTNEILSNLDAKFLLWNIRGKINSLELPGKKSVIQFIIHNKPEPTTNYWLVVTPNSDTDLCFSDHGFDVDLFLTCELASLASAWMGRTTFQEEISAGNITLIGNALMAGNLTKWMVQSSFAQPEAPPSAATLPKNR